MLFYKIRTHEPEFFMRIIYTVRYYSFNSCKVKYVSHILTIITKGKYSKTTSEKKRTVWIYLNVNLALDVVLLSGHLPSPRPLLVPPPHNVGRDADDPRHQEECPGHVEWGVIVASPLLIPSGEYFVYRMKSSLQLQPF